MYVTVFEQCLRLVLGLCGQPGLPRGANFVDSTSGPWTDGSSVMYTCDEGWLPSGHESVERTCHDGTWTDQSLVCRKSFV